jgi:hypothetical protein
MVELVRWETNISVPEIKPILKTKEDTGYFHYTFKTRAFQISNENIPKYKPH